MNPADQSWLENRIFAAVGDDFYLDRDEEKRIKEEGSARGIPVKDIELVIRAELDRHGAISERILLDELDRLLHQFTDNDRKLDGKEERDALDKVLPAAPGKKKGLDPRVAENYVHSFCKVNGITRTRDTKRWSIPLASFATVVAFALLGFYAIRSNEKPIEKVVEKVVEKPVERLVEKPVPVELVVKLTENDRTEIDDLLRRANQYVEKAQYPDPPERSAKAALDAIKQIDPKGQYRSDEVKAIANRIVEHYLALAEKSHMFKDTASATKWLERAKLLNVASELIREKERQLGILRAEQ